jgi:MoaA/NifB/PqqE/SkfB family radical SAM enzyme
MRPGPEPDPGDRTMPPPAVSGRWSSADSVHLRGREGKPHVAEGEVWPCVFSRWLRLGNVRESSLAEVYSASTAVRSGLRRRPVADSAAGPPGKVKCLSDYGPPCPPNFRKPCPPDGDQR